MLRHLFQILIITHLAFLNVQFTFAESFSASVQQIQNETDNERPTLLYPNRGSRLYLHPAKTKCSALVLHGLFQSPKDMITISKSIFELGCNVYAPLLRAHWNQDHNSFKKISHKDWMQQSETALQKVADLGDKVFVVGHSAGGLLAFDLATRFPEKISGLFLFAPALKLYPVVELGIQFGNLFGIAPRNKTNIDLEYDLYPKPVRGGQLVSKLIQHIFGKRDQLRTIKYDQLRTPTKLFFTTQDELIDRHEMNNFAQIISNQPDSSVMQFDDGITHDNIQRGFADVVPNAPMSWMNPRIHEIQSEISNLIQTINR